MHIRNIHLDSIPVCKMQIYLAVKIPAIISSRKV